MAVDPMSSTEHSAKWVKPRKVWDWGKNFGSSRCVTGLLWTAELQPTSWDAADADAWLKTQSIMETGLKLLANGLEMISSLTILQGEN